MMKCLVVVILLALPAAAQAQTSCYKSTSRNIEFCVNQMGQIASIQSPIGTELVDKVASGGIGDGFTVCRGDDYSNLRAYGTDDFYGIDVWPTIYQPNGPNTMPLTITMYGYGGLKLKQYFYWNKSEQALRVTMKVSNVGTTVIPGVRVVRALDFRMNAATGLDFGGVTKSNAYAQSSGPGLSLGADSTSPAHGVDLISQAPSNFDRYECGNRGSLGPTITQPTDIAGRVYYNLGNIYPGQYQQVTFLYRIF